MAAGEGGGRLGARVRRRAGDRDRPGARTPHRHRRSRGAGCALDACLAAQPCLPEPPRALAKGRVGQSRRAARRDWLAGDFIAKLAADFQEHGADAIRRARVADPGAYLGLVARLVSKDLRVTNDTGHSSIDTGHSSILARLGPAELAELRRQLEEALTLARAGHPLVLPPILDAKPGDDGDDG
jgi:hypothetical protein